MRLNSPETCIPYIPLTSIDLTCLNNPEKPGILLLPTRLTPYRPRVVCVLVEWANGNELVVYLVRKTFMQYIETEDTRLERGNGGVRQ